MKKNLFIIDDDIVDIKILKSFLTSEILEDFNILQATDSNKINDLLDNYTADFVFLDLDLRESSGFDWLKKFVELNQGPVIMLTGQGNEITAVNAIQLGATDYLPKQKLEYLDLKQIINRATENWELRKERDNLLGLAAHELRNPISVILGYSDMLKSYKNIDNNKTDLILDSIKERAEHLVKVINGILTFSHIEKGKIKIEKSSVNLDQLMDQIIESFLIQLVNKNMKINYTNNSTICFVNCDAERMKEVFSNLIDNAIKYYPDDSNVFINVLQKDENLLVEIKDEGQGIEDEELKFIFSLFANTKISSKPTGGEAQKGISLTICKKIVDKHSGEITVKSKPGEGSLFTVILPVN